jgi:hypothetical protein
LLPNLALNFNLHRFTRAGQIEHSVLQVGGSSLRNFVDPWFVDTAFFHKASKTLLVTDVVQRVSAAGAYTRSHFCST